MHRSVTTLLACHAAQVSCVGTDQVKKIHEEEWSFIPVGGPLPVAQQPITAFGAAANLVHPATGYSIARSLREAPAFAEEVANLLRKQQAVGDTAESVWDALWPQEKRRQVHIFAWKWLHCFLCPRKHCDCNMIDCASCPMWALTLLREVCHAPCACNTAVSSRVGCGLLQDTQRCNFIYLLLILCEHTQLVHRCMKMR